MNPEIKTKWLVALRSGKYKQGQYFLKMGNKYCCLGVLCESNGIRFDTDGVPIYENARSSKCMPEIFRKKANITPLEELDLMNMNDSKRSNFNEIADWIEKNL